MFKNISSLLYLADELKNAGSVRAVITLKNILLRIFKRSYRPHGQGAYFELQPEEKKLIESIGRGKWNEIEDKLWGELGEIRHALIFADSTPVKHYLFWSASHLIHAMQEIKRIVFLPSED